MVSGLVDASPKEIAFLLECGCLYQEMRDAGAAEEVFAGVAALLPHSDVPLILLGTLFFSQGQYERALRSHREAIKRQPRSALAQACAGEALLFLNRRSEAQAALERARVMAPDDEAGALAHALLAAMDAKVV